MADLAVLILTHNEEIHIERALRSVLPIAREVVVIDCGSTDRTVEIAKSLGARVALHPFISYAQQFQWGLDNANLSAAWVMRLDADEVIEPELAAEISRKLPTLAPTVSGVHLKRKHVFMGRWIRHGGRYPLTLLRIWRKGVGRIEQRWMDEHIVLSAGKTETFDGDFADINEKDLSYFIEKHNRYATFEALDVIAQRLGLSLPNQEPLTSRQAAFKRALKLKVYNKIPFQLGAGLYFLYRYVVRLGFLDGVEGLIYHGLQGGWYRFLVGAKVVELERRLRGVVGREAQIEALAIATGYRIAYTPPASADRGEGRPEPLAAGVKPSA
jgi:glycosyltransferase involved in cell wall biosynthesis